MKVNVVSLYPDRAPPAAFLGRLTDKGELEPDQPELGREEGISEHAEDSAGTLHQPGESSEIHGCLADAGEQRTKRRGRLPHKQPRFHIKTFLSKPGVGRTIVYALGKQILFEQGKRANAVFYILAGTVKLTVVSQGEETTIALLGPGNFAGKECMATVRPRRTASARALTNCIIIRIARKEMLRVIRHEKTFTAFLLDYLLACISRNQDVIVDQLLNSSEKRLARALLSIANFGNPGKAKEVVPQIHQEELAEMVGTTRSRISFFMNRFRKLGFIAYKGQSSITINTATWSRFVMA